MLSGDGTLFVCNVRSNKVQTCSEFSEDELLSVVIMKNGRKVICGTQTGALLLYSWGFFKDCSDRLAVKNTTKKEAKAAKDPNKPNEASKEDFRKEYKEKHPSNKSVAVVCKAGGSDWNSMKKAPFVVAAAKRKEDFEHKIEDYKRKLAGGDENESDKSKSEVHDEDEDGCNAPFS
ncbi:hypothetical protein CASFOL_000392 [Castilleja foliolosa]|uniref:HMG box domain-containing protein n=1 Tax=Castilleja foliolosa TaxID=1961234 RepID=A0ABD3EP82_9LAMI